MDVDILSEDGGHDVPAPNLRDQESEEIVKQLEKGLPPWPGFGEEGWSEQVSLVSFDCFGFEQQFIKQLQDHLVEVLQAVKSYKDVMYEMHCFHCEAAGLIKPPFQWK